MATVPSKPTKPTVAGQVSGRVALQSQVFSEGSSAITKWQYQVKKGEGDYSGWSHIEASNKLLVFTLGGFENGATYRFKVRAVNASGEGPASDESDPVTIPATTPSKPTAIGVSGDNASVELTWTAGSDGGGTITKWQYRQKAGEGNYGAWLEICRTQTDENCPNKASHTVDSLTNGTAYRFKVRAVNGTGNGAASDESAAVTPSTTPAKPTDLTVAASWQAVDLGWTAGGDGGSAITGWKYQQKEGNNNWGAWLTVPNSGASTTSHTITGLTTGAAYRFKVRAVNENGDGAESAASASATPPAATLAAGGIAATTATLTIGNYTESWYRKYTSPAGGACSSTAVSTASTTVNDLKENTSYTFAAYTDAACSTLLATAAPFPTLPPQPSKPAATAGTNDGELILASSVTGDAALTRWEYKKKSESGAYEPDWTTMSSTSATLNHTVAGLTVGTRYQFKVRAVNASGAGAESDASTLERAPGEVIEPEIEFYAIEIGRTAATLVVSGYPGPWWYQGSQKGAACTAVEAGTTTVSLIGLKPATSYTFRAYGEAGCLTDSELASTEITTQDPPEATAPPAPSRPTATPGHASVTLTWTSNGDGGAAIGKWQYVKRVGDGSFETEWTDVPGGGDARTCTVDGLVAGTAYRFMLRAVNSVGAGAPSAPSAAAIPTDLGPTVRSPLQDVALPLGGAPVSLDLAISFAGEDLTWEASVEDEAVVGIRLAGPSLTLSPLALGRTAVTVTAANGYGSVSLAFAVDVRDAMPFVGRRLPNATIRVDEGPLRMELADAFGGTSLRYAASSSNPDVARLSLEGSRLVVRPTGAGMADISVAASNGVGEAKQTFRLTVRDAPPRAVGTLPDLELAPGDDPVQIDIGPAFTGSSLVFSASSSNSAAVAVSVSMPVDGGGTLTLLPLAVGRATIAVRATNVSGDAVQRFTATVADRAPEVVGGLPAVTLTAGGAARTVDLAPAFGGTNLVFEAASLDPGVARVSVAGASLTASPVREGRTELVVAASNSAGRAEQRFAVVVVTSAAETEVLENALAAVGRATLTSVAATVRSRFATNRDNAGIRILGQEIPLAGGDAGNRLGGSAGTTRFGGGYGGLGGHDRNDPNARFADRALASLSFEIPFSAAAAESAEGEEALGRSRSWALWGSGDLVSFDGSELEDASFSGDARTFYVGVDGPVGERWLAGVAVSSLDARIDYAFASSGEGAGGEGEMRSELASILPYARYDAGGGREFWAALGAGSGDASLDRQLADAGDLDPEKSDLSLLMGLVGGRWRLGGSEMDLALVGDAGFAELETDVGERAVDGLAARVSRLRLGLEFSRALAARHGSVTPFGEVSARHDGGDGANGAGLEVAGGLRYRSASGRVRFEVQARTLALHAESGYRETGYSLSASVEPREGGAGFSLSVTPTWGRIGGASLFEGTSSVRSLAGAALPGASHGQTMSFRTRAAYGFRLGLPAALLAPFGEYETHGAGPARVRGGFFFGLERRRHTLTVELSTGAGGGFGAFSLSPAPAAPANRAGVGDLQSGALTHALTATVRFAPPRGASPRRP